MGTLTLRNTVSGTVAADAIMENFSDPASPGASDTVADVVNGDMDQNNIGRVIGYRDVRRGALFRGYAAGGTNSLDYFSEVFGQSTITPKDNPTDDETGWVVVPGLAVRFFVPESTISQILIQWSVNFVNDGTVYDGFDGGSDARDSAANPQSKTNFSTGTYDKQTDDHCSMMALFLNEDAQEGYARALPATIFEEYDPDNKSNNANKYSQFHGHLGWANIWSGACLITNAQTPGWHTASLRLKAHRDIPQTRIRSRNMRVLLFR